MKQISSDSACVAFKIFGGGEVGPEEIVVRQCLCGF